MAKKKEVAEEVQPVVPAEKIDKSVISSEDVEEVISGDENALSEQMERIKNLTKEQQLEAIEAEKRKKAELEKQKQMEELNAQKQSLEEAKIREQHQKEAQLLAQKKAEEERLRQQQELETKKKKEQELLQKQEEQKRLEQQKVIDQQAMSTTSSSTPAPSTANTSPNSNPGIPNQNVKTMVNPSNEKGGPSTFKRVMAAILFISLMVMVYFLPEITNYINDIKNRNNQEKITSGVLECTLKKSNEKLDIDIETLFYFTDSKLYKLGYTTVHTGDKTEDADELEELYNNCLTLKEEAGELEGVTISCSLNNGIHSNKQILDYEKLNVQEVTSAYTEAGGIYPAEFQKNEDIDKIESDMISNNYTCNRK